MVCVVCKHHDCITQASCGAVVNVEGAINALNTWRTMKAFILVTQNWPITPVLTFTLVGEHFGSVLFCVAVILSLDQRALVVSTIPVTHCDSKF